MPAGNRRLAQWRVTWLIEHSTSHQLLWCIDSFVLRNPPLRQAPNRYAAMKKTMTQYTNYYILIAFLLLSTGVKSQHCPFDFTAIIVVSVHKKDSTKNIPNIKITLVDSLGKPLTETIYKNGQPILDTIKFWQNQDKTTFTDYIDNLNPVDFTKFNFPFAKDNYVFVCGYNFPVNNYKIKIEEIDGRTKRKYVPLFSIVPLNKQNIYSLCGTYNDLEYSSLPNGTPRYKPVEVIMQIIE